MNRVTLSLLVGLLLAAACILPAPARTATEEAAIKVAQGWLALGDAGKYGEAWDASASLLKGAATKASFETSVKGVRGPLGAVKSRTVKSAKYMTSLPGAPDGKYVVIQFNTTFAKKASAVETVTPMLDKDGKWRVSGYYIR